MIFVDTGGLVGLHVKADPFHRGMVDVFGDLDRERTRYLTTALVLSEAFTMLGTRIGGRRTFAIARSILDSAVWTVVRPDESDDVKALSNLVTYEGLGRLSFCDAMSFTIMRKYRIDKAVSTDAEHFQAAGFRVLP